MCLDPGKGATKQAERAEAARQGAISGNVAAIQSAYRGREPQYADFSAALRERLNADLGRQRKEATRQSKFSIARSGLTGGSAAVDAGRTLAREGQEGVLNAERIVQKGVSDLRSADEQAKAQLISLAQSGSDIGNAAEQAGNMLRANIGAAQSQIQPLGDVFGATAATYRAQKDAAERRRGLKDAQVYANPFSRGP